MRAKRQWLLRALLATSLAVRAGSGSKRTTLDPSVQDEVRAAEVAPAEKAPSARPARPGLPGGGFQFPNVPGGQQLAELLTPSEQLTAALDGEGQPRPRAT